MRVAALISMGAMAVDALGLSMEQVMAMNSQRNGVGLEMFLNNNQGAMEHLPFIQQLLSGNREADDINVGDDLDNVKSNVSTHAHLV